MKLEDLYDFSNGKPCSDIEIQSWIDKCIQKIKEDGKSYYSIRTGNSVVIAIRYQSEIQVYVSSNYKEGNLQCVTDEIQNHIKCDNALHLKESR